MKAEVNVPPQLSVMRESDIAAGVELCRLAGWNQTARDWQRLLHLQPEGCFIAVLDGRIVGTVTTTVYGDRLAWIGMMLVDPAWRRRGVARAAMLHAVDYLQSLDVSCIKLDATPVGEPLYRQLGFQPEYTFHRWQRGPLDMPAAAAWETRGERLDTGLLQLDREAFGAERGVLLDRLAADSLLVRDRDGFGMRRQGSRAAAIGPVVARSAEAANRIVTRLIGSSNESLIWDVAEENPAAVALALQTGFSPTRQLTRMYRGEPVVQERHGWQYAFADPGTG